jgi:Domain of unknown function (DUF1707)
VRVSEHERQRASSQLQAACVDGYLSLDEFSHRVGQAMAAQTSDELNLLVADLPSRGRPAHAAVSADARMLVVLGSLERSGAWRLAERTRVLVACGACKLDLRRATVSAPLTLLEAQVVVGSLEIIVPIGVDVDVEVFSLLANKSLRLGGPLPSGAPPRILVRGTVVAGELRVQDRAPAIDVLR